jgi:glyoxylase-like metal-dependent hydrolase (beta-lactamase superfamily II)
VECWRERSAGCRGSVCGRTALTHSTDAARLHQAAQRSRATVTAKGNGHVVTFTTPDGFRLTGVINAQNLIDRIDTALPNPVLGDMPVEVTFANYQTFGTAKFPTTIVQRYGGHPILELTVADVKPNGARALDVPAGVAGAKPAPIRVASSPLGSGLWHIAGASHHSVLAEFADYVVIVEAPQSDERSLAVIAEARKLVANKPIRYVVNTHQHFDHSGGLRAYAAQGATIVTAAIYKPYYERAYANPHTISPDLLAKSNAKPVIEGVNERRVFSDSTQTMELHVLRGSPHNAGLIVAYFPKHNTLVQADIFTPAAVNLYENIERLKLDVEQIAPIHGRVAKMEELRKAVGQ